MTTIQIGDQPRFITSEEVMTGKLVRSGTWRDVAEMINYLNRYACKVLPYTRWGDTPVTDFDFVYPVDRPDYSSRYLTCLFGMRPATAAIGALVQVDSSSGGTDTYQSAGAGGTPAPWDAESESGVNYFLAQVEIEGNTRELIEVTAEDGHIFNSFGAWELPPVEGGTNPMIGPGISPGTASIDSAVAEVLNPQDYMQDKLIDATKLGDVQDAEIAAWERNRRIIFQVAPGAASMNWNTGAAGMGAWVSLPQGGIYVPAYAVSQAQYDAGFRHIRVAVKAKNTFITGTSQWRVETSRGNFNGTNWGGDANLHWMPMDPGTGVYDRTTDGIQAEVGLTGEWIQVGLTDNNDDLASLPLIAQVTIWED